MPLVQLSADFQSLPPLPTSKSGPSGVESQVSGFVLFWDPVGLSSEPSHEAEGFSLHLNPHRFFQSEVRDFIFPGWNLGLRHLSHPSYSPRFICM